MRQRSDRIGNHRPGRQEPSRRRGFTMIELIVVTAIVAVLAALAFPAITRVREAARKTQCLNNVRNIALALTQFDHLHNRLPASGSYRVDPDRTYRLHTWAVSILPHLEQGNLFKQIDLDKPLEDPVNESLHTARIPVYVCPTDLSRNPEQFGDLSYAVNGGVGFTVKRAGVRDCPVDRSWTVLDLNGDGMGCSGEAEVDDLDKKLFQQMGLFFLETRNNDITKRHHSLGHVVDGTSQTFLLAESVRVGFDPNADFANFADPNPYRCAFYIGNPCTGGNCSEGNVDYSRCNTGESKINSGLWSSEGSSPIPNSFHPGGVHMAFADAHVTFLSEDIDGGVYGAMGSPQGVLLKDTPLEEAIVSGNHY